MEINSMNIFYLIGLAETISIWLVWLVYFTGNIKIQKWIRSKVLQAGSKILSDPGFWLFFDIVSSLWFFPKRLSENQT